jgi:uncharacterized protein (DUF488 family)
MAETVFSIGHSTHRSEYFLALLRQHEITALCDVRSKPYSGYSPQFNRKTLDEDLRRNGMKYIFLGRELGARSDDPSCYEGRKVQYDRIARTELFREGLARVQDGIRKGFRLVLMCAEGEPLECHRTILVARHLTGLGIEVQHIHTDGRLESHEEAIIRLAGNLHFPERDLFRTREDVLEDAYRMQADRIAYALDDASAPDEFTIGSAAG